MILMNDFKAEPPELREAMLKIRGGEAVFERDSVLLKQAEPPFPLISGLLRTAIDRGYRTGDIWSEGCSRVGTRGMGDAVLDALQ